MERVIFKVYNRFCSVILTEKQYNRALKRAERLKITVSDYYLMKYNRNILLNAVTYPELHSNFNRA